MSTPNEIIRVTGLTNREFLAGYAKPGCIGLAGGTTLVDKAIRRAERRLDEAGRWSTWSHAFLFGEQRLDGHLWVIESDLQIHRKHIQLGVQENRVAKYHDEEYYSSLAVLDFGLDEARTKLLLREALELVAHRARYSLREILGTVLALRHPSLRERANLLERDHSFYCSAFVQHLYKQAGLDLAPGLVVKHTTPEHIARTTVPHTTYVLEREAEPGKLTRLAAKVRHRLKARARQVRRKF